MTVADMARVCHEANRAYCKALNDPATPPQERWDDAPEWQTFSCINGVEHRLANPNATPEQSHENWLRIKEAAGWTYGAIKNEDQKIHPCMLPYEELPPAQRAKDRLFIAVVDALRNELAS